MTNFICDLCGEPIIGPPAQPGSGKYQHQSATSCIKTLRERIRLLRLGKKPRAWLIVWASRQQPQVITVSLFPSETEAEAWAYHDNPNRVIYEIFEWICPDETAPE